MSRTRIDRWLFFARLCKTRAIAAALVEGGGLRVNGQPVLRPSRLVGAGDVLTLRGRVLRINDAGTRRGPAPEARMLYCDITTLE